MKEDISILLGCFPYSDSWGQKDATYLLNIFYITKLSDLQKLMCCIWLGF